MSFVPYAIVLVLISVVFLWPAWRSFRREEAEAREMLAKAQAAGRNEPVSIRPWVDAERCMGSGACARVCPEGDVLQVIDGKATIVNGAACIGHGACAAVCPTNAISLKFGSARRGVDIPQVAPDFQTNVQGMYIAGELGGMGLIANAITQGAQAVDSVATQPRADDGSSLDLIIVGAGPAGISASLTAKRHGLRHLVLEQGTVGGSVLHYPRKKIVMSYGLQFPGQDKLKAGTIRKEELVEILTDLCAQEKLPIREEVRVLAVKGDREQGFEVKTDKETHLAAHVLLAVGRRGTPRQLGVPGEELEKVAYRLLDPERVQHEHVLVVGGGDSAVEAACDLAQSTGNRVTLAYRKEKLGRPKEKNLARLEELTSCDKVHLRTQTVVTSIELDRVHLQGPDGEIVLPNDRVYVMIGGVLPTAFLRDAGIRLERHFGDRIEELPPDA